MYNLNKGTTEFMELCKKEVDPVINKLLQTHSGKRYSEVISHQVETGGKRLRPVFLFLSCKILGGEMKDAVYPAAAIEIMHNYTLIVDDIIDHSETRRGKPTLWKKYGRSVTDCVGMQYAASVFEGASLSVHPVRISGIMVDTLKNIIDGEIIDVIQERAGREDEKFVSENRYTEITLDDYLEMVTKKTAKLFEACFEIGGVCANGSEEEIDALKDYGMNLGISFQICDDILDIFGDEEKFGKKIGKDIEERKGGNLVILLALEQLKGEKKERLKNILSKSILENEDIKEAVELIKESGAKERAQALGEEYVKKGKESIASLPENEWKEMMLDFANYIISRDK